MQNKTKSILKTQNLTYPDLNVFKKELEVQKNTPHHRPYSASKGRVTLYKLIFWAFAGIFTILGSAIYMKSFTWAVSFLFGEVIQLRALLCFLCGTLAVSSGGVGFFLRPDREAKQQLAKEAKYRLRKIYHHQLIHHGVQGTLLFGEDYRKYSALRHSYQDTLDLVREKKKEARVLLDRILHSKSLDSETKEELSNQALLQLRDHLSEILKKYQSLPSPMLSNT